MTSHIAKKNSSNENIENVYNIQLSKKAGYDRVWTMATQLKTKTKNTTGYKMYFWRQVPPPSFTGGSGL